MTARPSERRIPDDVHVVEVHGSRFLLEWLDRDVLAAAAAALLAVPDVPAPAAVRAA
jgi:hypothetical protein